MKIAITGATGIIGRGMIEAFSRDYPDWELTALSRNPLPENVCPWQKLDVSDYEETYKTITRLNPDVVIHLAAMSKPEDCLKKMHCTTVLALPAKLGTNSTPVRLTSG